MSHGGLCGGGGGWEWQITECWYRRPKMQSPQPILQPGLATSKNGSSTLKTMGDDPRYAAGPVYGWCASDCVGIAQAIPYSPPPPVPPLRPSLPPRIGCRGSPGGLLSPLFCRHWRSLLLYCPSWALVYENREGGVNES